MSDEILIKLSKIISSELGVDESEIQADSHLQEDFDANPLAISDMLDKIEKEFDVKVGNEHTSQITTVQDLVNIILDQSG